MTDRSFTYVDLFCGAGGLSLGFRSAGFEETFAADRWPEAIATYRKNLFPDAIEAEIDVGLSLPPAEVIVGGPPCQGFSTAGMRRDGDERNSLVSVFAEIVARAQPRAFVFENVEGFLTAERGARLFDLLDPLIAAGYRIHVRKINAANYGVPQHRKRIIAIGGLGWNPPFPPPLSFAFGAPGAHSIGAGLPAAPTVNAALAGLPPPARDGQGAPQGHVVTALSDADLSRVAVLGPGMTMRDLPPDLQHRSYRRRAERRVRDGTPTERRGGPPAGLRRLVGDEPSKAITGGARSEFVHPAEDRPLTVREYARLQTFPDDFPFLGSPTTQVQLIGNAVPPLLANTIARTLATGLSSGDSSLDEGALLSFAPTNANGMSPILHRVTSMVLSRYRGRVDREQLQLWT